jgi:hypothetical protein
MPQGQTGTARVEARIAPGCARDRRTHCRNSGRMSSDLRSTTRWAQRADTAPDGFDGRAAELCGAMCPELDEDLLDRRR